MTITDMWCLTKLRLLYLLHCAKCAEYPVPDVTSDLSQLDHSICSDLDLYKNCKYCATKQLWIRTIPVKTLNSRYAGDVPSSSAPPAMHIYMIYKQAKNAKSCNQLNCLFVLMDNARDECYEIYTLYHAEHICREASKLVCRTYIA